MRERDRTPSEQVDVCIVGSGPAGSLVGAHLAEAGHDVVILEAGERFDFDERPGRMEDAIRSGNIRVWETDEGRDAFTSSGGVFYPLNVRRARGVGGSTLHWNGRADRFVPKDFEMQTRYGLASDWPIGYEDLRPFYAAAERELGVAGNDDNPFVPAREAPYPMEGFPPSYSDTLFAQACASLGIETHTIAHARNSEPYDGRSPCVGYGTCSPVCPSGAKYSADVHAVRAESAGARLIDRAVVRRLEHDPRGRAVTGAVYQTPDGGTHRQPARQFVLAGGAVENARLLLLSQSEAYPDGLANSSGVVGRYFMDKPLASVTGELDVPTGQHRIGFKTLESFQFYEPEESTPGSFRLSFSNLAGPGVVDLALHQREPVSDLMDAVATPSGSALGDLVEDNRSIEWGDDLLGTLRERYGNYFRVMAEIEPLPDARNRVTLSEERTDELGDPVPEISWNRGEHAERTGERAFEVIESIVDELDVEVKWAERSQYWGGIGHASGTTRMGLDPAESVVDADLRTHDLENLYISGASTFVTVGATAPTLTIAALAMRLADHLDTHVL